MNKPALQTVVISFKIPFFVPPLTMYCNLYYQHSQKGILLKGKHLFIFPQPVDYDTIYIRTNEYMLIGCAQILYREYLC